MCYMGVHIDVTGRVQLNIPCAAATDVAFLCNNYLRLNINLRVIT